MQVILLHGLARSARSMRPLKTCLEAAGHRVVPVAYASRQKPLAQLAGEVARSLRELDLHRGGDEIGFVCHSMGGLILRALPRALPQVRFGRTVLLGCPIEGSIVAARLARVRAVQLLFGPALTDLTARAVSALPPPPCHFGVIAGNTWSPLVPAAFLVRAWGGGRASDSTVLVDETRSAAAADHIVIAGTHTLLPQNREAQRQVLAFLRQGEFARTAQTTSHG